MESPQFDTATAQTPGTTKTKAGKLKTYAKQRASASKPMRSSARNRMASEELDKQQSPAQPDASQTLDETPVQAKAARKTRKRRGDPVASPVDEVMLDAPIEDAVTEQPANARKRRSKKQKQPEVQSEEAQEVEVPETQQEVEQDAEEVPEQHDEVAESEPEADVGAAEAEDENEPTDGDISQFDPPPDSDKDEEQAEPSLAKPKTKRKRQTVDNAEAASPAPSTKRVKRASMAGDSAGDYPEQGPFTPVEADMIDTHLTDFCNSASLTRDQLVAMIQSSSREMSKVYVELATDVLPHRNRRAVQRYCRRHYNNYQRGRWTDEQDELLRAAYAETPNKWVKIGEHVGRMPEDCRDRWRNHVSLESRHTDVWTQDEEQRLATAVRECLSALESKLEVALTRENEDDYIAWPVVVKKMNGSRNRLQCSMKWRKIKQRVAREEAAQREREEAIANGRQVPDDDGDGMTSPHTSTRWKAEAKRRFDEMTMGDMLDITRETLYGAQMGAFASKNTFWAVVTRLHGGSPWTTADRKLVYKRLKANITDTGDFRANLDEQVKFLLSNFDEAALAERSVPRHRLSHGGHRRSTGAFRSEEKVRDSDDEAEAAAHAGVARQLDEQLRGEVGMNGHDQGNGYVEGFEEQELQVPLSPHVSESAVDEQEDYKDYE